MVLLIDSDEDFRNGVAENLRDDGHEVQECAGLAETRSLKALERVDALIIGHQQPQGEELMFADEFHSRFPTVRIILVAAYGTHRAEVEVATRSFLNLRSKPIDYEDLHSLLCPRLRPRNP